MNIKLEYNCPIILSFFFISILVMIINKITKGKSNKLLFSTYRSSLLNPLTYFRLISHVLGHSDFKHLKNNFLYILLIGPMLEEKYGSINLLIMILITSLITGIINSLINKYQLLGSSSIVFMLIILSSLVNLKQNTIPLTLILVFIFYILEEIPSLNKKDNISHLSHIIGAICGGIYGLYIL